MVILLEGTGVQFHLSSQHYPEESGTRTQGFAHLAALCFPKEQIQRALAEHIENDLHGLHIRIFNRLEPFFPPFSTLTP